MSLILNQQTPSSVPTPSLGKTTVFVNTSDQLVTKDSTGNVSVFPTISPGGNTGIFYNNDGSLSTSANLSFNNTTNTVTVLGNVAATGVVTNNLYYANGNPWDLEQPAGSNTQVQFNNNSSFGASSSFTFDTATSTLTTANLSVTGNAVITGDLAVNGNVTYINVETLAIEDPLISVGGGPNGNALTSDDGKDRGTLLQYYTSTPVTGFMGWDNSNGEFAFGSNVSVSSDVVTFNTLGKTRAGGLFVGANAIQSDFPNAKVIVSQNDSGQNHSENIGIVGEAVADSGNTSTWGIGVLGEARANGATKATGVQGGAYVTNSSDSGAAVGVRGYATQTHAGGYNIGVLGNAAGSGLGNYAFYVQSGNIASIETDNLVWDLADNSNSALMFNSSGKANIFGIETTDGAEGIYTQGYLNVSGNASAGGVKTDNLYYANGTPWDFQQAAGSNTYIQYNANGDFGASSNFTFDQVTDQLYVGGNIVSGNANLGNVATANFFTGTLTTASQPNITTVGTLTNLEVSGNIVASGNITSNVNISAVGNVGANNISVLETLSANVGNFFNVNVSNLASIDKLGTANGIVVGTVLSANGNIRSNANIISNGGLFVLGTANLNNLNISGNIGTDLIPNANVTYNLGNNTNRWNNAYLGTSLYIGTSNITANGSNLDIGASHVINVGNIEANNALIEGRIFVGGSEAATGFTNPVILAEAGGATYVQVGLINTDANGSSDFTAYGDNGNDIAGWMDMGFTGSDFSDANFTITKQNDGYVFVQPVNGLGLGGNLVIATGNQGANRDIVFATGGFLEANEKMRFVDAQGAFKIQTTTAATSTTTGALVVSGGVGIAGNAYIGGATTVTGNVTAGNLVTAGALAVTGNVSGGNLTTSGQVVATGNVTGSNLSASGTLSVTGNANVGNLDAIGNITGGNLTTSGQVVATGNVTGGNLVTGGALSVTGNANVGNLGTSGLIVATGNVTGGNLVTGGALSVTGNANVGNLGTAGLVVATGNVTGGNLTTAGALSVTGNANVGNIGADAGVFTTVTGTLTTAAQPNITSVGTLTSVAITGNATAGNVYANSGTIGASLLTGTLTTAAQPNITSTGTLTSLSVTGNASAGNINAGNLLTANFVAGTLTTASQPNVTSLGTLSSVTASGNIQTSANIVTDLIVGKTSGVTITATGANQSINLTPTGTGTVDVGTFRISNVATPTDTADAATKQYVDNLAASGIHYHEPVFVESPDTAGSLNATYNNGTSGVGATLTNAGTQAALTIDGVLMTVSKRVLIYNQTNQFENGVYVVTTVGTASTNWVLTRASDADTYNPFSPNSLGQGDTFFVTNGNTGAGETYICNTVGTITFGTTAITFAQISDSTLYTAGTGLSLNGTEFSISNTAVTTGTYGGADVVGTFTVNQQGQLTAAANTVIQANAANLAGTTLKSSVVNSSLTSVGTLTSLAVTGNVSAGNLNTAGTVVGSTLTSNVVTGTAPLTVSSTTRVANLNVNYANVSDFINVATGTGNNFIIFANAATGNVTELTSTGLIANLSNNSITATTFVGALSGAATSATTAGTVTTAAQPNITSTGTLTSLAVTGNISAGNVSATTFTGSLSGAATSATTAGTVTTAAQPNITSTGTLTSLAVTGNISAGNVSATTFTGSLSGAATSATTAGTVTTAAQPNITSVGTLSSVAVTGNVTAGNVSVTGQLVSTLAVGTAPFVVTSTTQVANLNVATAGLAGYVTAAAQSNITSLGTLSSLTVTNPITGNISGSASTATTAGTVTTAAQPNITSVGTLTSLNVTGTVSAGTLSGAHTGSGAGLSSLTGANVTGTVANATYAVSAGSATTAGTVTTAAQPNITSVGTLLNLTVKSNIAYVSPNAANTITSSMLNGGTLAWSGNAGQLFSITDSMTGNIFSVNDVSGIPMISVTDTGIINFAQSGGFVAYGVSTGVSAAGTTQGGATALTRPISIVSTVSAGVTDGVVMPTTTIGMRIMIINTSAAALKVYPASGGQINALGTNAAFSLPANGRLEFISATTTQWYTLNATYA